MTIDVNEPAQAWLVNKFLSHNVVAENVRAFLFDNENPTHSSIRGEHVDVARDFVLLSEEYKIFPPVWVLAVAFTNKGALPRN